MDYDNYKNAYERQKLARERAEKLLENRSRELYEVNQELENACRELKDKQAQLIHQEKLASIGQLSAGIAHEINNPAGCVKSNLQTLADYMHKLPQLLTTGDDKLDYVLADIPELISETSQSIDRIIDIAQGLNSFSPMDREQRGLVDINSCIERAVKLVATEVPAGAVIEMSLSDLPVIAGREGNIIQVLVNILLNACHAVSSDGLIVIGSEVRNGHVVIVVDDNGMGMDENTLNRLFDPFYTTKTVGKGTGLGLSISAGLIRSHGGTVAVRSLPGEGACFTITLPLD